MLEIIPLEDLFSYKSRSIRKMALDVNKLSEANKISLMLQEPSLLRRPITIVGGKPVIGLNIERLEAAFATD